MMISRSKHRSTAEICADCGASDPSWASINRGLLLCAECCSVHRSMGRHISHIKSLRQGTWPPSLLAMVQALTAQNANSIWEHSLLDTSAPKHLRKKPQPKDPLHPTKSEFILAKHLRLAYVLRARRDEPPSELGRQLHSAVRSSSLDTALRLLAQGADPNYYNQEKGTACLHVACRAGQPAQAELLVAWGADPTVRDHSGLVPADCARQGGHAELADRMTELVYEATDRMIYFLTGEKPEHAAGRHYIVPRAHDTHEMTDVAKAARGKLQLLPNHLFEELVMDIYDEIDRRETEAIWQTSATGLERCGVVFLPVNPALSAPRNQGRQKLARLSTAEMATLLRDVLVDATRRQHIATLQPRAPTGPLINPLLCASHLKHISQMSDDEPLYDSVASDDDYAALAPIDLDMNIVPRSGETVSSMYNASLPTQSTDFDVRRSPSHAQTDAHPQEIESLKKELNSRDSTITELKNQLKNLQSIVEQLTKENSVLKTSSIDDESVTSLVESTNGNAESKPQERGKSLDTELTKSEDDAKQLKCTQRPVSMYETREGPKNNWQVTKHQLTTLSSLDRSLTQSVLEGAGELDAPPTAELVQRRAEGVTRGISELWAAARDQHPRLAERADVIRHAVNSLLLIFPQTSTNRELNLILTDLRVACEEVTLACNAPSPLHEVRAAAYDLAKATKTLVTHFQPPS
ncbi:ARF GTPase-activating protein GIT2 isoform X1 [Hyposmocoma kahamanoa]|uniref:ARF GTPase-activating protein GIT2 isoform X1 n=2 Tax=Hyposmocoma kahamanoa TaxID=1477025 RepID=UPI000E6D868A|nr:ARF GTPase-activating protein GIT2 isoform X1 [Hyposmocoma kahamanoa]